MSDTAPDHYGVFGHPISHSWSPFIHGLFAKQTNQNMVYRMYDVEPEDFRPRVRDFFMQGGAGLNITVPHKRAAVELASEVTERARRAGAANTLYLSEGRIAADNTDGAGLVRDLRENLRVPVEHARILILGAGGATRGVLGPLLALRPESITLANRTPARAEELVRLFARDGQLAACGFDSVPQGPYDLVINATSAGLSGDVPQIGDHVIGGGTICYDMSYGRSDTPFLKWARARGAARSAQGWGMLVEQAAESFFIWRAVRPDTSQVLAALSLGTN